MSRIASGALTPIKMVYVYMCIKMVYVYMCTCSRVRMLTCSCMSVRAGSIVYYEFVDALLAKDENIQRDAAYYDRR